VTVPRISIVTPVYNGELHLAECVRSVVAQTRDDWEYVIIDNCSTDRTAAIVEEFARTDDRIRYERHETFVGAVENHNRAFRAMHPESAYCKVVGADDWLYPECLEKMVALAERTPSAGVISAYRLTRGQVDLAGIPYEQSVVSGREIVVRSLRSEMSVTGSPTSMLLRSDLVRARDPFYDETFRHADTESAYWALMRSELGFVHQVLTFSRGPEASETTLSNRIKSHVAERIRMLIRYGPEAMGGSRYRQELRQHLFAYVWWLAKQRLKPSRWSDDAFQRFHGAMIELMVSEAPDDRDVRWAASAGTRLLRKTS
jgi:glycosyltransferase involved in cell wall biosynthesis